MLTRRGLLIGILNSHIPDVGRNITLATRCPSVLECSLMFTACSWRAWRAVRRVPDGGKVGSADRTRLHIARRAWNSYRQNDPNPTHSAFARASRKEGILLVITDSVTWASVAERRSNSCAPACVCNRRAPCSSVAQVRLVQAIDPFVPNAEARCTSFGGVRIRHSGTVGRSNFLLARSACTRSSGAQT